MHKISKNCILFILAFGVLSTIFNNINIAYAESERMYSKQSEMVVSGPGYNKEKKIDAEIKLSTNSEINRNNLISMATASEIWEHDGIKYVKGEDLGSFKLTGYCACNKCSSGTGITYSGKYVRPNHTVAADLNILPLGTMIILDSTNDDETDLYSGVYQVEDKGGGVKNKHIDIFEPSHDLAALVTYTGYKYAHVYIAMPIE